MGMGGNGNGNDFMGILEGTGTAKVIPAHLYFV